MIFQNEYAMSLEFKSLHDVNYWILKNIYALCTTDGKHEFCDWLKNIWIPDEQDRLNVGDFNLMRTPRNRNRQEGHIAEMLLSNEAIKISLLGKGTLGPTNNIVLFQKGLIGSSPPFPEQ